MMVSGTLKKIEVDNLLYEPLNRSPINYSKIQKIARDYFKDEYLSPKRLSSYGYQYHLAIQTGCTSFLNIGNANNILKLMLNSQKLDVIETDIDINTKPTVVSGLPDLPYNNKTFETILCFQVLEHLPIDDLQICLREMIRVSQKYIIISLPDHTLSRTQKLKSVFYKIFGHPREWKNYNPRKLDAEHFWEIGNSSINFNFIVELFMKENLKIVDDFRNPLFNYHHFFLLQVKT